LRETKVSSESGKKQLYARVGRGQTHKEKGGSKLELSRRKKHRKTGKRKDPNTPLRGTKTSGVCWGRSKSEKG